MSLRCRLGRHDPVVWEASITRYPTRRVTLYTRCRRCWKDMTTTLPRRVDRG